MGIFYKSCFVIFTKNGAVMRKISLIFVFYLLFCAGCSPEVPAPPVERNDLVVRFFRSLRSSAGEAAAQQGAKLYAMDKRNYALLHLVAIQQANNYIRQAQGALNGGHLEKAIRHLENGLRRFPDNAELHKQLDKLRKLRHAEKLFIAMRTAPNPTAMNSALIAAQTGLSGIESAKLNRYFENYKKNIERWNRHRTSGNGAAVQVPIRSFDDK